LWSLRRAAVETRLSLNNCISRQSGVNPAPAGRELIVSLTTTGRRLGKVHLVVESLLRQTRRPQRLILWLSEELGRANLPPPLLRQRQRGLELRFRRDLGAFTKLVHALTEHPQAVIVTADDDTLYPQTWLEQLHDSYQRQPESVHCHRAHWIATLPNGTLAPYLEWDFLAPGRTGPARRLFPTGVGGVLYPPGALHPEVLNEQVYLQLCPTADDAWFKAMALLQGVSCAKVSPAFREFLPVRGTTAAGLYLQNWKDGVYDRQIRAVFDHYDLVRLLD